MKYKIICILLLNAKNMDNLHKLTTTGPKEGPCISVGGGNYRIVVSGAQTGGAYAVIDMVVPGGGGPPPHAHADMQESFYVLEGEVEIRTEERTFIAVTGSFVNIPLGGMVHCFKNNTDNQARLWCVVVPAGLDAFFMEAGRPVAQGELIPAPPPPTPDDLARLKAVGDKYGQKFHAPDYLG